MPNEDVLKKIKQQIPRDYARNPKKWTPEQFVGPEIQPSDDDKEKNNRPIISRLPQNGKGKYLDVVIDSETNKLL
ncbi:MAG: hypothetical protein WAV41_03215 [Microgenomates group bacterium]